MSQTLIELYTSLTTSDHTTIPSVLQLTNSSFWLNWYPSQDATNPDKILKRPLNGKDWQNKLADFQTVHTKAQVAASSPSQFIGYGFAYTPNHPYICIDTDADTKDNQELISSLQSYTEVSPSKKGFHVIVAAQTLAAKQEIIALYGNGQRDLSNKRDLFISIGYVTVTGILAHPTISPNPNIRTLPQDELLSILQTYFKPKTLIQEQSADTLLTPPQEQSDKQHPPSFIKTILDKVPVKCLPSDIFLRLSNNEPALLDLESTEEAREPWLIIGQALHHHYKGGLAGFQLWNAWSQQGNKYDEETANNVWSSFSGQVGRPVTIAALFKLADAQSTSFPSVDIKGRVTGTIQNFSAYLNMSNILVQRNVMTKQTNVTIPPALASSWMTDPNTASLEVISELMLQDLEQRNPAPYAWNNRRISRFLDSLGGINLVNPISDYFHEVGQRYDNKDYIESLLDTIIFKHAKHRWAYRLYLRKWLIQVVAAACHDSSEHVTLNRVIILVGPQGIGKTRWVASLFPRSIQRYCTADKDLKLGKFKNESVKLAMELTNTLICNINEIDRQFTNNNFADFKVFLDQTTDQVVLPYGSQTTELTRRTVFIGSSNEDNFLQDQTGNRRFELIPVTDLNHEHSLDIDQLWAQAYAMYKSGEPWWFDHRKDEDRQLCSFRDAYNSRSMNIPLDYFYEELDSIFDATRPMSEFIPLTLAEIRTLTGITRQPGRPPLPLKQIKSTLSTWRASIPKIPDPYPVSKSPKAAIMYVMPPLRTLEDTFPAAAFAAAEQRDRDQAKTDPPIQ